MQINNIERSAGIDNSTVLADIASNLLQFITQDLPATVSTSGDFNANSGDFNATISCLKRLTILRAKLANVSWTNVSFSEVNVKTFNSVHFRAMCSFSCYIKKKSTFSRLA